MSKSSDMGYADLCNRIGHARGMNDADFANAEAEVLALASRWDHTPPAARAALTPDLPPLPRSPPGIEVGNTSSIVKPPPQPTGAARGQHAMDMTEAEYNAALAAAMKDDPLALH